MDPNVAEGELRALLAWPRTPEHRANPGQQLAKPERLAHVVVRAQLEPLHAIHLFAASAQHDHGDVDALAAQLTADVPAAHPGHHDVEQHQVRRLAEGQLEPAPAVAGGDRLIALEAEVVLEAANHFWLVVDDQNSRHLHAMCSGVTRSRRWPGLDREVEREPTSLPRLTRHRDASGVRLGDVLDQSQAHPASSLCLGLTPSDAIELLEDSPGLTRRDADALVRHL